MELFASLMDDSEGLLKEVEELLGESIPDWLFESIVFPSSSNQV